MNLETSNHINEIRNNSNDIISLWIEHLEEKNLRSNISRDDIGAFSAFLQLVITNLESPGYRDHLSFLSKIISSRLGKGLTPHSILIELDLLKAAIIGAVKTDNSREGIVPYVNSAFLEWTNCLCVEYSKYYANPLIEKLENVSKWTRGAIANIPLPVVLLSPDGIIQRVSREWLRATDNFEVEMKGISVEEAFGKDLARDFMKNFAGRRKSFEIDSKTIKKCDKLPVSLIYLWVPILDDDEITGAMIIASRSRRLLFLSHSKGACNLQQDEIPEFGKAVTEIRKQQNISNTDLARKVKLAKGFLSMIAHGKARASIKTIQKIVDILDPDDSKELLLLGVISRIPPEILSRLPWP